MSENDTTSTRKLHLESIRFRRYKALRDYTLRLDHLNALVGPNNCGKSTVIGAFRLLAVALPRARSKIPERVQTASGSRLGYWIPEDLAPVALENVHTNYDDVETTISFRLTDGSELILLFPADGGVCLIPVPNGRMVYSPAEFRRQFPLSVGVIPVLSAFEPSESLLSEDHVRRSIGTHLAARHFRNYWHYDIHHSAWGPDLSKIRGVSPSSSDLLALTSTSGRQNYWEMPGRSSTCSAPKEYTIERSSGRALAFRSGVSFSRICSVARTTPSSSSMNPRSISIRNYSDASSNSSGKPVRTWSWRLTRPR